MNRTTCSSGLFLARIDMKIELENHAAQYCRINRYSPGSVVINEQHYTTSVIVCPERVIAEWTPCLFSDLDSRHLDTIVSLRPELVILGTGASLKFPSAEVLEPLLAQSIGFEIMDTGAACRSYNILVSEGRRVIAGLLMIEKAVSQ